MPDQFKDCKIENFFRKKLENYEVADCGRDLFPNILSGCRKTKENRKFLAYKIAASFVVFAILGAIGFFTLTNAKDSPTLAQKKAATASKQEIAMDEHLSDGTIETNIEKITESSENKTLVAQIPTEITAPVRKFKYFLPDSSCVTLEKGSKITFTNDFGKAYRRVKLDGIAYFEVTKNKQSPFIIESSKSRTVVTGTSFLLFSTPEKEAIYINEGIVQYGALASSKNLILKAGMNAIVKNGKVESLVSANDLSWKTGTMSFKDQTLKEVANTMEVYFNKSVILNSEIENCRFSGDFTFPTEENMLEILKLTLGVQAISSKTQIVLKGEPCK